MKKCIHRVIVVLILLVLSSPAFGGWSIVRQTDWTTHFRDVTYADSQHAWAVGDLGVIAATSDGGENWMPQNSGVKQNLQRVTFIDPETGWIAGDGGVILHTTDGGSTWHKIDIGTEEHNVLAAGMMTADITSVYFIDANIGWVTGNSLTPVGSIGAVYYTRDGGVTWKSLTTIETPLYDVYFIDMNNGWATGGRRSVGRGPGSAAMLFTNDGGKTWIPQNVNSQNPISSVYFADNNDGWAFGIDAVLKTQDNGRTWEQMFPAPEQRSEQGAEQAPPGPPRRRGPSGLQKAVFAGPGNLWGINSMGRIVRIADDGRSMVPVEAPAARLTDIDFASPDEGCAVGEYGAILTTSDGGKSWVSRVKIKADTLRSIAPVSDEIIWCVGSDGVIYKSDDGGQNWQAVDIGVKADFQAISFVDANNGWMLARISAPGSFRGGGEVTGIVLKTSDGGVTWSEQLRGPEYPMLSISVVDPQNAYMGGSGGIALGTNDGGAQWTQQSTEIAWDINDIAFINPTKGWAAGWVGIVLRTDNGGQYWTRLSTYTSYDLSAITFINDTKGWAVGDYGIILTTDDAGETWNSQRCYSYANLRDVYFADADRGWIVGDSGSLFETKDGGKTWEAVPLNITANLYNIKKGSDGSLWIAGEWGIIIKGSI